MHTLFLVWTATLGILVAAQGSFPIATEEKTGRKVYDVVIVGGGLTGLAAARRIQKLQPNASVVILEARGQVGGRVRARSMATAVGDDFVDLGAQFVSRDHHALQRVASELGIRLIPQSNCGERSLYLDGVRKVKREVSFSPELSVRPSFQELINSKDSSTLATQSVADFANSQKLSVADAAATNRLLQTLYDAPEQKVAALQVALTAASDNATVSELLLNTGHGHSLLVEGGAYQLTRTMADGLHIEYNQKVVGINRQSTPAVVMSSSSSYLAREVIIALPPAVAATVVYSPPLEQPFHSFLEQYKPVGEAYYFTMTFPTAFWRGSSLNGQLIHTSAQGPLAWLTTFDTTSDTHCVASTGTTGVLWGIAHFVNAPSESDRFASYVRVVKKGLKTAQDPLDVKDLRFSSDPLALGSVGVLPPGVSLDSLKYLTGVVTSGKHTFLAAAELSNVSTGLMNGAIVAGEAAADAVLNTLAPVPSADGLFRDSPLPIQNQPTQQQNFVYSTSTHYPPTETKEEAHIVLAPALFQDGGFQYSTSTHYPPSMFQSNSIKEDAAVQQDAPQTGFVYRTSTMYPPTEKPLELTTYKHFSFGNLDENDDNDAPANLIATPDTEKPKGGFVYRTSTMYPPTAKPLETTTYTHFSFGNAVASPVAVVGVGSQGQPSAAESAVKLRAPVTGGVQPEVVEQLQQVAQQAPSSDALSVAATLSGIVQQILQGLRR